MPSSDKLKVKPLSWLLSVICAVSGTILYILTTTDHNSGLVNLLWGSFYGLGFFILSFILSPQPGLGGLTYFIIGAFVWPVMATIAVARVLDFALRSWDPRLVIVIFIMTILLVYPVSRAPGTIVYYLPIYGIFLEGL